MRKTILLFVCLLLAGAQVLQAQRTITGTIISADDNLGIPGATVTVRGTTTGTSTDFSGRFSLNVPATATHLVFAFMGMETQEIEIGGRTSIDVVLQGDATMLDEFVVVAYGVQRRGTFTGSATTVGREQLERRTVTNVANALQGNVAGLQMTSGSGQPGDGGEIAIRGFGSINAGNNPLIIVDGATMPSGTSLASLNPDDIASITVLRDAASAALYGSRAANGVILITTRTGRTDRSSFSATFTQGFTSRGLREYETVGPEDFYRLNWQGLRNSRFLGGAWDESMLEAHGLWASNNLIDPVLQYNITNVPNHLVVLPDGRFNPDAHILPGIIPSLDWFDPLERLGTRSELTLSASMANERSDLRASLGYMTEQGWINPSSFQRLSARVNMNHRVNDWLRTGLNVRAVHSEQRSVNAATATGLGNFFARARNMGPIFPVWAHDLRTDQVMYHPIYGTRLWDFGEENPLHGSIDQNGNPLMRPFGGSRHVIAELLMNSDVNNRFEVGGRGFVELSFLRDFTFTANFAQDEIFFFRDNRRNPYVGDGRGPNGDFSVNRHRTSMFTANQLLNWNRSFGGHHIGVLLGHESYRWDFFSTSGLRDGVGEQDRVLNNYIHLRSLTGFTDAYRLESYFSRVTYSWNDRFFGSASWRTDGSSKFSPQTRWGQFWSVGAGWRLDKESFLQGVAEIQMLKLRSSFGQIGNDAGIGYYAWQAIYDMGPVFNNAGEVGARWGSLGGLDLTWESSNSFDVALEFGLRSGFRGYVEFFHRQSSNLLFEVPVPVHFGFAPGVALQNVGTMFNRGFEMDVSYTLRRGDFSWTPRLVLTHFRNRITRLTTDDPDEAISAAPFRLKVGHSRFEYWLREWYGVDPADGRALYVWDPEAPNAHVAANIRVIGTDTFALNPAVAREGFHGSPIPAVMGGFTNTFTWRNFDLSILLTYQIGGQLLDRIHTSLMDFDHSGNPGRALHVDLLNAWRQPGDITNVPRIDGDGTVRSWANHSNSTRFLTSASYLQLRSINFGYNLPREFANRMRLSGARVFFSAENMHMFAARRGMNPIQRFSGIVSHDDAFTPARTFMVGLNVNF